MSAANCNERKTIARKAKRLRATTRADGTLDKQKTEGVAPPAGVPSGLGERRGRAQLTVGVAETRRNRLLKGRTGPLGPP